MADLFAAGFPPSTLATMGELCMKFCMLGVSLHSCSYHVYSRECLKAAEGRKSVELIDQIWAVCGSWSRVPGSELESQFLPLARRNLPLFSPPTPSEM